MGAEVARARQEAQQAAQQAAAGQPVGEARRQAAQQAAFSPLIDTRMLTKPRNFSGKEDDWTSFATVTRAYCGALDPRLLTEMMEAHASSDPVANVTMDNEEKKYRSQTLYCLLLMLV